MERCHTETSIVPPPFKPKILYIPLRSIKGKDTDPTQPPRLIHHNHKPELHIAPAQTYRTSASPCGTHGYTQKLETFDPPTILLSSHHPGHLFIHMNGPSTRIQVLLDLKGIETDQEWLDALRHVYSLARGWTRPFFRVNGIHYAEVSFRLNSTFV
jgi:hypothetical protein